MDIGRVDERASPRLLHNSLDDAWMAVSIVCHGEQRDHVNVSLAVRIGDYAAFCAVPNNLKEIQVNYQHVPFFAFELGKIHTGKAAKPGQVFFSHSAICFAAVSLRSSFSIKLPMVS